MAIKKPKSEPQAATTPPTVYGLNPLLKIDPVCRLLGMKKQTVYGKINGGIFPIKHVKVCGGIRFKYQDVKRYLDEL